MCRILICFSLLLIGQTTISQGFAFLEGRVLKSDNREPLTSAVITMPSTGFNTAVNEEGYFRLMYPNIAADSLLLIGGMGYETLQTSPREISQENPIEISLDSLSLQDMSLGLSDAKVLVSAAIDSIAVNYPSSPFRQDGFFRESTELEKVGFVDIKEAHIRVERFPEEKSIKTKSRLLAAQRVNWEGQHNKVAAFGFENAALLVTKSFETELPDFLTQKKRKQYEFNIDSLMVPFLGDNYLSVSFKPYKTNLRGGRMGKLYIHPITKVIARIEYSMTQKSMGEIYGNGLANIKIKGEEIKSYTQFVPYMNKWVLSDSGIDFSARFEERLDKKFNTFSTFKVRFVPYTHAFIKKSSISEFNVMVSTTTIKEVEFYASKLWENKFMIPATEKMNNINKRLTKEEFE